MRLNLVETSKGAKAALFPAKRSLQNTLCGRSVHTPSAQQMHRPICKTSLDQWRNYESWLAPLKEALDPEVLARHPIADL